MLDKKISFQSKIPDHLLVNETPAMQYLMQELSKNTQATEYLLEQREAGSEKLDQISTKLDYTNGSIAKAKKEIFELQEKVKEQDKIKDELDEIITIKHFIQKWMFNKYGLIFLTIFIIGAIKIATNDNLRDLLMKILGIG